MPWKICFRLSLFTAFQKSGRFWTLTACLFLALSLAISSATIARAQDGTDAFDFEAADLGLLNSLQSPRPTLFFGLALTNRRTRNDSSADGSATVGLSFGDVDRTIAVQAAAVITSLTDEFGDSGYLTVRFARRTDALGFPMEAALTFTDIAGWGDASANTEKIGLSFAISPVYQTPRGRQIPLRFSVGVKAPLSDLSSDQEYSLSAAARWTPRFSTSLAVIDGRTDIGAGLNFYNVFDRNESLFVGLAVADVFDTDDFRRVTLRTGISIPVGN